MTIQDLEIQSDGIGANNLYTLSRVFSTLDSSGVNDAFYPFIDSYLKKKIVGGRERSERKPFIPVDYANDEVILHGGMKSVRVQCITQQDLEHILYEIIGVELSPRIDAFEDAKYTGSCRIKKSRWVNKFKDMPEVSG